MKARELALNPLTYVAGLGLAGVVSIVSGVAVLAGLGWALVVIGAMCLATAAYIVKGMKPNG
jgi:hypothetical protein